MKYRKELLLILTLIFFIFNSFTFIFADQVKKYDYEQFVEAVKEQHGVDSDSPESIFKVIVNEGKEDMREIGEVGPEDPVPYDHSIDPDALNKMPIAAQ